MRIRDYIFSKLPYLIMNFIMYLFLLVIFVIADVDIPTLIFIFIVWFTPLCIYLLIDCINKKRFYDNIESVMDRLDKKYLLPEIIKRPNFYEGSIIYNLLQESNRDMHEHVNYYKNLQSEYREYIEAWVHEIKTPISSSRFIAENSEGKVKNVIGEELHKIQDYVEQALYYSRSTGVSNDYMIKEFDISEAVMSIIRKNRRSLINKRIQVQIEECKGLVITDRKWVEFIINQIVINSINYSKDENQCLKVYAVEKEESLVLTIEDNGVGICEKDVSRVFNKGFTGENGRKFGKSTGIGLYLAKKLCEKLGLGIELKSKEDIGTTVNIIFPLGNLTRIN